MTSLINFAQFELLKATGDLPSPRGVALAIMRATQTEHVALGELANIIKADPAFAGRLIKAANGLLAYGRRPVASIDDALMLMGLPAVRNLALGFSLLSDYRKGSCTAFDYERYWSSSLIHAVAMQILSARTRAAPADESYCLGLLCRVGELALATLYPDEYSEVLSLPGARDPVALAEFERQAFAMTHAELSAAMLSDWGIPKVFIEPVFLYEKKRGETFAGSSREAVLTRSLNLARQISRVCLASAEDSEAGVSELMDCAATLSFGADEILGLCNQIVKGWREWGQLIGFSTWPVARFESQLCDFAGREPSIFIRPPEPPPVTALPSPEHKKPGALRVLVVEPDPSVRQTLRDVLSAEGHEFSEAASAEQGAEMAVLIQPQLMIVDLNLPGNGGIDLVRRLRQTRIGRSIYVLALTDHENEQGLIDAFESGVDDFMTTPINARVLGARLRSGLRVIRLHQEIERDRDEIRHFAAGLAVSNLRLQDVALTDPLTGFANRRCLDERLGQEWSASRRSGRPLCCMMIDLDGFKQINDTYGHDIGDAVLRQAAEKLKSSLRNEDVIARSGGDEFVVLCPATTLDDAGLIAERIRGCIAGAVVHSGLLQLKVTASIGLSCRDETMPDALALLKCADEKLYLAKNGGRNQVCSKSSQTTLEKTH